MILAYNLSRIPIEYMEFVRGFAMPIAQKDDNIKVIVKNPPTKENAEQKIKELSEFLSQTWKMPLGDKKA